MEVNTYKLNHDYDCFLSDDQKHILFIYNKPSKDGVKKIFDVNDLSLDFLESLFGERDLQNLKLKELSLIKKLLSEEILIKD